MPDEANSHYYNILTQLTEGHLWLSKHLNYAPRSVKSLMFYIFDCGMNCLFCTGAYICSIRKLVFLSKASETSVM